MSFSEPGDSLRAAFVRLLEQRFALRLAPNQVEQVDGVVMQLLATTSCTRPADLLAAFTAGQLPRLLEALAISMTIGETHFFRVTPQIDALRRTVLPDLIARHATDRRLRVWSAGCSTGEEPYTLAMLLCELLPNLDDWNIQLVATDLNRAALEVARLATYGEWSFRDSPPQVRARYFTATANRWQLNERVRRMVRFAHLNLAVDSPPFRSEDGQVDLISCRNVTIYFEPEATQRLYERFAAAMAPAGWLLLGPSDPVPAPASTLEVVPYDGALFWRRQSVAQRAPAEFVAPVRRRAIINQRPAVVVQRTTTGKQPETAAPISPSMDPLVHLHVGMARLGEGAPAAAIDSLRRAAFLDETSALVQFSLGRAYQQMGDPSRSRSAFARARRLLAGIADDQPLAGGDVAIGELRHAVEVQLADLDGNRP